MKDRFKSFSIKKILILVTILALPGFCYYLLQKKGENRYKSLPFYGEKKLSGTFHSKRGEKIPDTTYHQIEPFSMLNTEGDNVTFDPDSGVSVVSFFYTGNQQLAEAMQTAMEKAAIHFERNGMVRLFSITVDPSDDTPGLLKKYRKPWDKYSRWEFLSADSTNEVAKIARQQFLVNVIYDPGAKPPFTQGSQLVLVDSKRRIRGYYDALVDDDTDRLIDEITLLLTEEYRNISVSQYE